MSREGFKNPHIEDPKRRLKDFLLWKLGRFAEEESLEKKPEGFSYPNPTQSVTQNSAIWINHSTFLLSFAGVHFLTDPIFSKRCSPLPLLGPKRHHPPAISLEELPKIDIVLISHDHYDHLDKNSVIKLHLKNPDILWIVPLGVKKWFSNEGIVRVSELNWWEEIDVASTFRVTATPAQHFSGRALGKFNKTLWAGYVVEHLQSAKKFYFVGDTGYNPQDFDAVGKKWPSIELSMIPIGSYRPRPFMSPVHICPRQAVQIHREVNSQFSLAMHWKTFRLSEEPMDQPPYDLYLAMQKAQLAPERFVATEPGLVWHW